MCVCVRVRMRGCNDGTYAGTGRGGSVTAHAQLKKKRESSSGVLAFRRSSSSTTGREMVQFCCRWMPLPTCSRTASTTLRANRGAGVVVGKCVGVTAVR